MDRGSEAKLGWETMEIWALVVSVAALAVSVAVAIRQLRLARHTNSVPVLVDMFREHRGHELAETRVFVHEKLRLMDQEDGLASVPSDWRERVRDLLWFYDNLGVLVIHNIVDADVVSGYLGAAATSVWQSTQRLIVAERDRRRPDSPVDPERWQAYFELMVREFAVHSPSSARSAPSQTPWWRLRRLVTMAIARLRQQ